MTSIAEVWAGCLAVTSEPAVAAWLREQGVDPERVASRDLARVVPVANPALRRLVLPLYRADGEWEGLAQRAIGVRSHLSATVDPRPGLVLANPVARAVLTAAAPPPGWSPQTLIVTFSIADYLDWASGLGESPDMPAVLGMQGDGWTRRVAGRIPPGTRVLVRLDRDPVPEEQVRSLQESLEGRCEVRLRRF